MLRRSKRTNSCGTAPVKVLWERSMVNRVSDSIEANRSSGIAPSNSFMPRISWRNVWLVAYEGTAPVNPPPLVLWSYTVTASNAGAVSQEAGNGPRKAFLASARMRKLVSPISNTSGRLPCRLLSDKYSSSKNGRLSRSSPSRPPEKPQSCNEMRRNEVASKRSDGIGPCMFKPSAQSSWKKSWASPMPSNDWVAVPPTWME
mmetsp:Transcript_16465/g.45977  ORF Transcript_16465/g.45977 Transcript_16465/m.45977 type:complete len:202 (-) Transcript_16465:1878-2483(-)